MWRKIQPIVLILSLAMNMGFASAWIAGVIRQETTAGCRAQRHGDEEIWCPLHRRLGVSEAQWREIEPRMLAFHDSTRVLCQQMQVLRGEVIDHLMANKPDLAAIEALQKDIEAQQQQMQGLVLHHLLRQKRILTPGQWRNLLGMMRGNGGCGGHGPLRAMPGRPGCGDSAYRQGWRNRDQ